MCSGRGDRQGFSEGGGNKEVQEASEASVGCFEHSSDQTLDTVKFCTVRREI